MSAYVVEDKVINEIVTFLATSRDCDWERSVLQREHGFDLRNDTAARQALGDAMMRLNCQAVDQRYGPNAGNEFHPGDYKYRIEAGVTTVKALKRLRCWIYQCSEGNVPESSLLYQTMAGRIAGELALSIVRRLPEWEQSESTTTPESIEYAFGRTKGEFDASRTRIFPADGELYQMFRERFQPSANFEEFRKGYVSAR